MKNFNQVFTNKDCDHKWLPMHFCHSNGTTERTYKVDRDLADAAEITTDAIYRMMRK